MRTGEDQQQQLKQPVPVTADEQHNNNAYSSIDDELNYQNDENDTKAPTAENIVLKLIETADASFIKGLKRDELIRIYNEAMERRSTLRNLNKTLNHKILSNLNKSKSGLASSGVGAGNSTSVSNEAIQQYNDLLREYAQVDVRYNELSASYAKEQVENSENLKSARLAHAATWKASQDLIENIMRELFGSKASKTARADVEQLLEHEATLGCEMSEAQLENLKLLEGYNSLKEAIHTSNETMSGCHLIDYEQLTAENQTLQEKIDDRVKEVQKLEEKTNQEITGSLHIDEKLSGIQSECEILQEKVIELDEDLNELKKQLNEKRIKKDSLNKQVAKEQNHCVSLLFSSKKVLKDYEKVGKENGQMEAEINECKSLQ